MRGPLATMALAILLAGSVPGGIGAAHARYEGPWCAHIPVGLDFIESRCNMRTFEMCRRELGALGGAHCTENPYYRGPTRTDRPRKPVRRLRRAE